MLGLDIDYLCLAILENCVAVMAVCTEFLRNLRLYIEECPMSVLSLIVSHFCLCLS